MAEKSVRKPRAGRESSKRKQTPKRSNEAHAAQDLTVLRQAVESVAERLYHDRLLKPGAIVFKAAAGDSAAFTLVASETGVQTQSGSQHAEPLLEVIGDPRRIEAILRGTKDARKQFFTGGIRVRGDMHYLSQLGMQLGFLKTPIV
jgi:SCP-2 sterol transfer family